MVAQPLPEHSTCRSLRVLPPETWLLEQQSFVYMGKALQARKELQQFKNYISSVVEPLEAEFEKELSRIARMRNDAQANEQGVPRTESLETYTNATVLSQLSPAERFLVKKAYRYAARLAHPDNGGSAEEFHAVRQAYLQGDLTSLQEFALARHKSVLERYAHWSTELERPAIALEEFKQGTAYKVARLVLQGKLDMARQLLRLSIEIIETQLLKARFDHGTQTRT